MNRSTLVLALAALPLLVGCSVTGDLGVDCTLVRRNPADGGSIDLTEGEVKPNKDFISFGSAQCEDRVCVRDATFVAATGTTPQSSAHGYCSKPCAEGNANGCPAANSADDKNAALKLSCRAMLLDKDTLAAICQADPEACRRYFPVTSPFFCARGSTADAGQ